LQNIRKGKESPGEMKELLVSGNEKNVVLLILSVSALW
jgi:hypothetical protein